ncbi:MAG TPA: pyruvate dehydrogenase complex E1 component subunit beta [Elusimicrobiota bacterium]|nr:pyruvate dehydrogenase complex E1 component subunit beta [Elusimicrobiota bacterium]
MSAGGRIIKFGEALREAMFLAMEQDPAVFVMGIGVDDHKAVFGSTRGLVQKFGKARVFDIPISENALTGVAVGAALGGLKPVFIHIRCDFLYLAMDQLFNIAAKWRYMFGGQMNVPMVIRCVIGRSWGQGAQHSQNLTSFFMHVPGIKVAMPTTANEAQGLLLAAIEDPNPVVLIEHRLLYDIPGHVPERLGPIPFGRAEIRRTGKDVTLVASSYMAVEALKAAEFLESQGIDVEIVDPVSLVPLDRETIVNSVKKTGKLLVVDSGWSTCGVGAEIAALAAEKAFASLTGPVRRLGQEQTTCPVSKPLEKIFYPDAAKIAREVFDMMGRAFPDVEVGGLTTTFKGPF